jgi:Sec-independent protein secretion pathway component TatC
VHGPNIVEACEPIIELFAIMALIVMALATMVGFVKPADCVKHCAAILGIAVVLILVVSVFVSLWSSMSLWQRAVVAMIGFYIWRVRWQRRQPRKKREEE